MTYCPVPWKLVEDVFSLRTAAILIVISWHFKLKQVGCVYAQGVPKNFTFTGIQEWQERAFSGLPSSCPVSTNECLYAFKTVQETLALQSQNRKPETSELQVVLVAWLVLLSIAVIKWRDPKCLHSCTFSRNGASADLSFPAQFPHRCLAATGPFSLCLGLSLLP